MGLDVRLNRMLARTTVGILGMNDIYIIAEM